MNEENRTPEEIERDIERERAELQATLNEIKNRYSFEALARQAGQSLSEHGGDIARSALRQAKDNPVPLALTAIGLLWLMSGRSGRVPSWRPHHERDHYSGYRSADDGYFSRGSYDDGIPEGAAPYGSDGDSGRWPDGWRTDRGPIASGDYSDDDHDRLQKARESAMERWETSLHGGHDSHSSSYWRSGRRMAGRGFRSMGSMLTGGWRRAGGAYSGARASAAELAERLQEGTHDLSEDARRRVVAARQAAYDAQVKLEEAWSRSAHEASEFFEARPLVAGALAVAAGAAVASMLPRTDLEDETMGRESDRLFDEANRIFREERRKASKVVRAAADEAASVMREKRDEAGELLDREAGAAAGEVRSAANRIVGKAVDEADKQGLGKSLGAGSSTRAGV